MFHNKTNGGEKMSYQIKIPSCVYGGEGCIENVKAIVEKEGKSANADFDRL